jgi:hypothetical protein
MNLHHIGLYPIALKLSSVLGFTINNTGYNDMILKFDVISKVWAKMKDSFIAPLIKKLGQHKLWNGSSYGLFCYYFLVLYDVVLQLLVRKYLPCLPNCRTVALMFFCCFFLFLWFFLGASMVTKKTIRAAIPQLMLP